MSEQITFIIYEKILPVSGLILEINGMHAIFQKECGNKKPKKGKIFKNLGKNVQNLKIF